MLTLKIWWSRKVCTFLSTEYLSKQYLTNLVTRILCKAFLKSKQMTSTAFASSTDPEISSLKKIKLVKHSLVMVNPCWLFPTTLNLNMASSYVVPGSLLLVFLKLSMTFAFLQRLEIVLVVTTFKMMTVACNNIKQLSQKCWT